MIKSISRFMMANSVSISILIGAFLISIAIWWPMNLDELEKMASIFVSILAPFSIFVAISTYKNARQQDNSIFTLDQVKFFREKIIDSFNRLRDEIEKEDPSYTFPRIIAFSQNPRTIAESKQYKKEVGIQVNRLKILLNSRTKYDCIPLLNMLEEFSLRVLHFETSNHEALNSVKDIFVQIVEENLVFLLFMRAKDNPRLYPGIFRLYDLWQNEVDRGNSNARVEAFLEVFYKNID